MQFKKGAIVDGVEPILASKKTNPFPVLFACLLLKLDGIIKDGDEFVKFIWVKVVEGDREGLVDSSW